MINNRYFTVLDKILDADLSFQDLLNCVIRELVRSIPSADAGIIYLYNKNRRELIVAASHGYPRGNTECSLLPKEGAAGQCYALGEALVFSSADAVRDQMATLRPASLDCYSKMRPGTTQILSIVAIPLKVRGKIFGVISLDHYEPTRRAFNEDDLLYLQTVSGWISLIINGAQSHAELKQSKRSYRQLLGKFIASGEDERKRIAREIHDDVNQLLLSIRLKVENVENTFPPNMVEPRQRLEVIKSHINQVLDDLHRLSQSLRPPGLDERGLPQALDWYVQNLHQEPNLRITFEVTGLSHRRPAPVVETELFRIAQESLSNIIKHAQATSAKIELRYDKSRLVLLAEDNGRGFDASAALTSSHSDKNLGILGMRERAEICGGSLEIDSAPGHGTRLKVEIPRGSYDWGAY